MDELQLYRFDSAGLESPQIRHVMLPGISFSSTPSRLPKNSEVTETWVFFRPDARVVTVSVRVSRRSSKSREVVYTTVLPSLDVTVDPEHSTTPVVKVVIVVLVLVVEDDDEGCAFEVAV